MSVSQSYVFILSFILPLICKSVDNAIRVTYCGRWSIRKLHRSFQMSVVSNNHLDQHHVSLMRSSWSSVRSPTRPFVSPALLSRPSPTRSFWVLTTALSINSPLQHFPPFLSTVYLFTVYWPRTFNPQQHPRSSQSIHTVHNILTRQPITTIFNQSIISFK